MNVVACRQCSCFDPAVAPQPPLIGIVPLPSINETDAFARPGTVLCIGMNPGNYCVLATVLASAITTRRFVSARKH